MNTNYFTKVEDKYVFNVSLIFWHVIIALASLVIVISLLGFLWGAIPPSHQKVVKQPYPEKKVYPAAVKVNLSELNFTEIKKEKIPDIKQEVVVIKEYIKPKPAEDLTGIDEYEAYLDSLKILIPPSKYSWKSVGSWYYPEGERYWKVYKQKKYRKWVIKENGLEGKINISFKKANAKNYLDKKQLLIGYINIVKLLPEIKRKLALQYLMKNIIKNVNHNINIYNSLSKVINKIKDFENINYINSLTKYGKYNPNDGIPFIDYVSTIISKFDKSQQSNIINNLINSYYGTFNQNLSKQKEATNLYLPLAVQIKPEQQAKAIFQYYRLFIDKNYKRDRVISQIEYQHNQDVRQIDRKYSEDQINSQANFYAKKERDQKLRFKALTGIGGGIVLIVLIASILAFLSIQRIVKRMEEKMINSKE